MAPSALAGFDSEIASEPVAAKGGDGGASIEDYSANQALDAASRERDGHSGGVRYDKCKWCSLGPEHHHLRPEDRHEEVGKPFWQWLELKGQKGFCKIGQAVMSDVERAEYQKHHDKSQMQYITPEMLRATGLEKQWNKDPRNRDFPWSPLYTPKSEDTVAWAIVKAATTGLLTLGQTHFRQGERYGRDDEGLLPVPKPNDHQKAIRGSGRKPNPHLVFVDKEIWQHMDSLIPEIVWQQMVPNPDYETTLNDEPWIPASRASGRDVIFFCRPKNEHMEKVMCFIVEHAAQHSEKEYHIVYVPGRPTLDHIAGGLPRGYAWLWSKTGETNERIHHYDYDHGLCPIATDLLSMNQPNLLREVSLDTS